MKKNYLFPLILFISMILGGIVGIIYPNIVSILEPFGNIFVNMLFTIVVPLVFFTIVTSILKISNTRKLTKILVYTFITFVITSLIAGLYMFLLYFIFNPGKNVNISLSSMVIENVDIGKQIVSTITVSDFKDLFSRSNMLALIIFSLIFGISLKLIIKNNDNFINNMDIITNGLLKFISIIMYYAPIGVFCFFASLVNQFGLDVIGGYTKCMILYFISSVLFFLLSGILYTLFTKGKRGVKLYFKNVIPSFITSLSTQSSLASLPTNIVTAKNMELDDDVTSITLPIGSTMHMEGSSMGSMLKIMFLFSIFGMNFYTFNNIIFALIISILSSVVMSGIPGGGLIGELLIVSIYGFSNEAFIIISTIGWLIDAPATMMNVTGDLTSSFIVDRLVNKKV